MRDTIVIQDETDSRVDAAAGSTDGFIVTTKAELSHIVGASDEMRIVTTTDLTFIKSASDTMVLSDSADGTKLIRIWYNIAEPTVPINFGKILASYPGEEYFNHPGEPSNDEIPFYDIVWDVDIPSLVRKDQSEIDDLIEDNQKMGNALTADMEQENALRQLEINTLKKNNNLPPTMTPDDEIAMQNYVQLLQGDIDNPSGGVYNPPAPPGITIPSYNSLTVTVNRVEGWQSNLGFEVVLNSADENFSPAQLALAVYNAPDCVSYQYTTGAFTDLGDGVYGATCPAGFEPGNIDIHFGLLYTAVPMSCWTMPQDQMEQTVSVYEEV